MSTSDQRAMRAKLAWTLGLLGVLFTLAGLAAGSSGWSPRELLGLLQGPDAALIVGEIRAPRTVGAWLTGALFGLAGAIAQGLFRNPLADPFLLGSASGATLGVVLVLGAGNALSLSGWGVDGLHAQHIGLVSGAFLGALGGVSLTLLLAAGAQHTMRLLLAGVVVGVVLGAASDMVTTLAPEALRGKQAFLLGSTGMLGWQNCMWLGTALLLSLPLASALARVLDALTLGDDAAQSLGMPLGAARVALVFALALATGVAVSQAGLIAFVGLVAPHLVRRCAPAPHRYHLLASAAMGGVLLLAADVLARSVLAPAEVPVGVLTAVLGGGYLLWLLHRGRVA